MQLQVGKELDKYERIIAMGSVQDGLRGKYSAFNDASGEPTHDKDGKPLEGKVSRMWVDGVGDGSTVAIDS